MDTNAEFTKLTTKFLFLNYNDGQTDKSQEELNNLLNDLNSLEYNTQHSVDKKAAIRLLESFTNISANADTLIIKACSLLGVLVHKQKIVLSAEQVRSIVEWQVKCLDVNFYGICCEVLSAVQVLFKHHASYSQEYWPVLLGAESRIFKFFSEPHKKPPTCDSHSRGDITIAIVHCVEALLSLPEEFEPTEAPDKLFADLGAHILTVIYSEEMQLTNSIQQMHLLTASLSVLTKIATHQREWTDSQLGELLGAAKAYILFGLPGVPVCRPHIIHVAQQSLSEVVAVNENKGGKMAKTRKPRTGSRNRKSDARKQTQPLEGDSGATGSTLKVDFENPLQSAITKTSDSDFSESETSRALNERHKQAKLRLTALTLIGVIAKNTEKRNLYGYWHALFPSDSTLPPTDPTLLTCVLRDPNPRCRVAALQATSVMIFGSKAFLAQAESSDKVHSSFTPFSITLGHMVLAMYEALTQALSNESSLPVLTQILKCFSVIIQATPFHRLKSGFVTKFMKYPRRLVYHKDPTIQVGALMIMEFLISVQEITPEISEVVGIPKSIQNRNLRNLNKLNDSGLEEALEQEFCEEILDSDCEDEIQVDIGQAKVDNGVVDIRSDMSWLLQRVLENLGVIIRDSKQKQTLASTPVRIECLQIITAMSSHFLLLKNHMQFISAALKLSLSDPQADVRLYTAKCLDAIGHAINNILLEAGTPKQEDLLAYQQFWMSILPCVRYKVIDSNQTAALKLTLCDFMSNIGVHIFERLPHASQIWLISLLSGISCNEANTVRAAAVRALAVYVLFPSLRENLGFVENTAVAAIGLVKDPILFVRVKASWAMGNVSDALITNCQNSDLARMPDDLLKQLLESAKESTTDNDKVRCNAVRTLGNLLRLITQSHTAQPQWRSLITACIEKLVNCMNAGGSAKVKWNACYAVGNFMKNANLFATHADFDWPALVFPSLCSIITNNANFKVRINGTAALTTIQERACYGGHLQLVWRSLLLAMEQSNNLIDFNEYKHRDNLQEQICQALSHLLQIATPDDLLPMKSELAPHDDVIRQTWLRVVNRVLPENAAPLIACTVTLKELAKSSTLTNEQKQTVRVLAKCFVEPCNDFI